ncbi:hypothetical protein JXB11_02765 [Candidatus Woesearchaeota archaeon]|nr:hypothetical protein [Candidatus Woesearchaeota archaeon]
MKKSQLILLGFALINFIILAVPASALSIAVHVPEKYTDVTAGERLYFEIEVKYPENPSRKDLKLDYEILKEGEIIAQSKVLKAIETQASFMDFIVIPESAESGMHIIRVKIADYESLSEEVEASFHVTGSGSGQVKMYFLIILGVIVLVGILVAVDIVKRKR